MITVTASGASIATTAHAISNAEFQQLKKDCISIGKRVGVRGDGSFGCGSEPSVIMNGESTSEGAAGVISGERINSGTEPAVRANTLEIKEK